MTDLVVRRLLVDLEAPLPRRWLGGDAFRTAFFDALSMSFPAGEQFFIDSVRAGARRLPRDAAARFEPELRAFVGQEATHRRLHALVNAQLERNGFANAWDRRIRERFAAFERVDVRHAVAVTAANEHFTAILAHWLLEHPRWFDGTEPRLAALWFWHASEELEHRGTAFALYRALGGDERRRRRWMRVVTAYFVADLARQTLANLRRDRALWSLATWRSAAAFLFGRDGVVRGCAGPWRRWFRADFHPAQQDDAPARAWLAAHASDWRPVA